ncbi:MAG: 4'-phosphopantetheinyl transferase superfamily protein [Kiritimatiellae bacterium]|nr:4'-phosphopantetheinyl transferase superfamily protein [Kiritimatiellia bacterium]
MSVLKHLYDTFDSELCLIGARNPKELAKEVDRLINFIDHASGVLLEDIAYTCARSARRMPMILALVAVNPTELRDSLILASAKIKGGVKRIKDRGGTYYFTDPIRPRGQLAFLFPGVLSFYPDMLRDLATVFDSVRDNFDQLEAALYSQTNRKLSPADFVFPPAACYRKASKNDKEPDFAKSLAAVHCANTALYNIFSLVGIIPDGVLGYQGGDFAAMDAAGVFGNLTPAKRVQFISESYKMFVRLCTRKDLPTCTMLATVDATPEILGQLMDKFPGRLIISGFHSPKQHTLTTTLEAEKEILKILSSAGVKVMPLSMDRPFNTPWCSKSLPTIQQFLAHWVKRAPRIPLYSCTSGERLTEISRNTLEMAADQWIEPINFEATIERMYVDGYRIFVELGARGNLTNAINETLRGKPHVSLAANRIHRSGLVQLHHTLGMLAAQGVQLDLTKLHANRRCNELNLRRPHSVITTSPNTLRLTSELPLITAFSLSDSFLPSQDKKESEQISRTLPKISSRYRLDFGADFPMLANAEIKEERPGELLELSKVVSITDYPFLKDYSLGTTHISFSKPALTGLTILSLCTGLEMMAEAARKLVPRRRVAQIVSVRSQRWLGFERGAISINIRAENINWRDSSFQAVKVELRDNAPDSEFTDPVIEAIILLSTAGFIAQSAQAEPLITPHPVNWFGHEIYPNRLFHGSELRAIRHVDLWSEGGINFEIQVPGRSRAVKHTRMPLFSIWPALLDAVVSSIPLWRSHGNFPDSISIPFRCRSIIFYAASFTEGSRLNGYMRITATTPRSQIADIKVSDGNGNMLIHIRGWEELSEPVPDIYHKFVLNPSETFITGTLPMELLGNPTTPVATAVTKDIPFKMFESNQELWLKTLAFTSLSEKERIEWLEMQGATSRRVEWLFGRIAAKEALRRYLINFQQARWTCADIDIWPDDSGKPHPLGTWRQHSATHLDLSIAHTSKLIVAAVAANARLGIDIEMVTRDLSEEFTKGVFTPAELELAAHAGEGPVAILRFWCAKEAISKALGVGIRYSPKDLQVLHIDPVNGEIQLQMTGQWLDEFKPMKGRKTTITTSIFAGHVFAACMLPNSIFDKE